MRGEVRESERGSERERGKEGEGEGKKELHLRT